MSILISSKGVPVEGRFQRYFAEGANQFLDKFREVDDLDVELSEQIEGKFRAKVETSFYDLRIYSERVGVDLVQLGDDIFCDLGNQVNLCRDLLR